MATRSVARRERGEDRLRSRERTVGAEEVDGRGPAQSVLEEQEVAGPLEAITPALRFVQRQSVGTARLEQGCLSVQDFDQLHLAAGGVETPEPFPGRRLTLEEQRLAAERGFVERPEGRQAQTFGAGGDVGDAHRAGDRAVSAPDLQAKGIAGGDEDRLGAEALEQRARGVREVGYDRRAGSGNEIDDPRSGDAVVDPRFGAVVGIVGGEVVVVSGHRPFAPEGERVSAVGERDRHGSGFGAVCPPEPAAGGAVGSEQELTSQEDETRGPGAVVTRKDVLHPPGPGGSAVGAPELGVDRAGRDRLPLKIEHAVRTHDHRAPFADRVLPAADRGDEGGARAMFRHFARGPLVRPIRRCTGRGSRARDGSRSAQSSPSVPAA